MTKLSLLESQDAKLADRFKKAVEKFVEEMDACASTGLELNFGVGPKEQLKDDNGDLRKTIFQITAISVKRVYNH